MEKTYIKHIAKLCSPILLLWFAVSSLYFFVLLLHPPSIFVFMTPEINLQYLISSFGHIAITLSDHNTAFKAILQNIF